jgi:hypothetical protein
MKIVGCDLHTRYQQIAMLDDETAGGPPFRPSRVSLLRAADGRRVGHCEAGCAGGPPFRPSRVSLLRAADGQGWDTVRPGAPRFAPFDTWGSTVVAIL